ncbi:MAG: hypothetical protein LUC94_01265 [Clostridiales bacterium]|nr:hypothetical protein [Clostridiales bacterium]
MKFDGNASFGRGNQLVCNGELKIGKNFSMNAGCILNASKRIHIGDDFLAGWGVEIIDGDGHRVLSEVDHRELPDVLNIGNHVWCAKHVTILKGAVLQSDSVCAANAVITREFDESNLLIGGTNKILKRNINWER